MSINRIFRIANCYVKYQGTIFELISRKPECLYIRYISFDKVVLPTARSMLRNALVSVLTPRVVLVMSGLNLVLTAALKGNVCPKCHMPWPRAWHSAATKTMTQPQPPSG